MGQKCSHCSVAKMKIMIKFFLVYFSFLSYITQGSCYGTGIVLHSSLTYPGYSATENISARVQTATIIACARTCFKRSDCISFQFISDQTSNSNCLLIEKYYLEEGINIQSDPGSDIYSSE